MSFQTWPEPESSEKDGTQVECDGQLSEVVAELNRVRDELQSTIEELQTGNEELKASNEEVTSVNEELQSTNEEMETSKEELQSLNEELTTVNSQLQIKMEELESATNDLTSLLSSTDIAVIFLDRNFSIRRYTPATRNLIDLIESDVGRPLRDLALKFTDPDMMSDARIVLDRLVPSEKEVTSHDARWYVRRILPYRTTDDRIEGVVLTFLDISRRHQAEEARRESEEHYRLIVQGVKEYAIAMLDPEGQFATWNAGATNVLGYSKQNVLGLHLSAIYTPEDRAAGKPQAALAHAQETGESLTEGWYIRNDGSRMWGSGVISTLHEADKRLRGYALVMRDNTERKAAEDRLEVAMSAAEAANEAKDQFLATVSHELRTPMSAILLWSHILRSSPTNQEQFIEGIATIEQSAEAQRQLIEDLLDQTRIASGKLRLNLVEMDPTEAVRSAVETIRATAQSKQVQIGESYDPALGEALLDPDRIRQIAWNVLANAVKFTPEGGRVDVTLHRAGDFLELVVKDTGVGIDPSFLPRIFTRFAQAEPVQHRNYGGLGLGLTIAHQLTTLQGGSIAADSDGVGKGETFIVRFPTLGARARPGKNKARGDRRRWGRMHSTGSASCWLRMTSARVPHSPRPCDAARRRSPQPIPPPKQSKLMS